MQLLNASDVIEPMPVPDSPLPLLSVAAPFEDAQDSETPLRVSVRVALPGVAATGPPGLTVQVCRDSRGGAKADHRRDRGSHEKNAAGTFENRHESHLLDRLACHPVASGLLVLDPATSNPGKSRGFVTGRRLDIWVLLTWDGLGV